TVTSDACSARSLGPGKSCGVVVQFDATSSGQLTATLTANGRKELATASITLIGTGAASRHVYWTNSTYPGSIGRADFDGQNVNQSFITSPRPDGVAVDGSHIYWANQRGDAIGRADLDGQNVNESFITGASSPYGVAVDGSHVYWTNSNYTIGRADLDGQNVNQSFITRGSDAFAGGLAVDPE